MALHDEPERSALQVRLHRLRLRDDHRWDGVNP